MSHALVLVAIDFEGQDPTDDLIEAKIAEEMEPYDENGEWFRDGSRWDWWVVGGRYGGRLTDGVMDQNVIQVKNIDLKKFCAARMTRMNRCYDSYEEEQEKYPDRDPAWLYGINEGEAREQFLERMNADAPITAYAFLKQHNWNERGRMGFFGCTTPTECERAGQTLTRCKWRSEKEEAIIISWNEDDDDDGPDIWNEKFYDRFLKKLDPELHLVAVDYHV